MFSNIIITRNGYVVKSMIFHQTNNAFTPIVDSVREINKAHPFPMCSNIDEISADHKKPVDSLIDEINTEMEVSGYVLSKVMISPADTPFQPPTMF